MSNDLIKQAIADAKALRQSAYELAKEQIAETFGPRVQEMIRLKLSEIEDDSMEEVKDMEEEGKHLEKEVTPDLEMTGPEWRQYCKENPTDPGCMGESKEEDGDMVDEATLDELLAELEKEDGKEMKGESKDAEKEAMKEAEGDDDEESEDDDDSAEAGSEEGIEGVEGAEAAEEVTELTVDELKDIIRDVVADVMATGGETLDADMGGGEEGAIDLDSTGGEGEVDEITLDEILASLEEADDAESVEEKKDMEKEAKHDMKDESKHNMKDEAKKMKMELQEAYKTIKTLQTEMSDIKLLNAKLMYVNKIFNSKNLNESQKVKVINAFDRAENVREAKKIYETLKDSFDSKPVSKFKKPIRESIGFASKPAGIVPKAKPIVEQNDIVDRWQVLAGIRKIN